MKEIELNKNWSLVKKTKDENIDVEIDVEVPSSVFEALINNKIIENPFYGLNEHAVDWVYKSDWEYSISFDVSNEMLKYDRIILRFDGIDTISKIELNDTHLDNTDNMFRHYEYNVKELLKSKNNELKVLIQSPYRIAQEEIKKHGHVLKIDASSIPGVQFLRKAQYSFGWDWGPRLPDIGIWKPVKLIGCENNRIDTFYLIQNFKYNKDPLKIADPKEIESIKIEFVNLEVQVELDNDVNGEFSIEVMLKPPNQKFVIKDTKVEKKSASLSFDIKQPELWWIHELGTPNLYELTLTLKKGTAVIDERFEKIGIRDLKLVRNPDKWGETFYFLLNGVPVFAKGANWIPIDSFIPRGKKLGLYAMNLQCAKKANMNMIRVWGGGIYEDDEFYNLCDELGILVWQDCSFACAIYESDQKYLDNVKVEVTQNVKSLRNHSCLALWCGNNEVEWFIDIYELFSFKLRLRSLFKHRKGNIFLFEEFIHEIINNHDPQRPYWPSSPSNGGRFGNRKRGLLRSNSPKRGDSHYWGVWHLSKPFSAYRSFDSRFMSEFGFESFPSMKTIETFCPPDQYDFYSPIMENHQKNRSGNKKIMKYMKRRFIIPKIFEKQVVLSQITQGEAIEYGVEHWRINRNNYHCMGSLYWQLNDCWPVASWSSLDYYGRWKALHYFAKRFYKPFLACAYETKDNVDLYLINDLRVPQKGKLKWEIVDSNGTILAEGEKNETATPCSSLKIESIDLHKIIQSNKQLRQIVIFYYLYAEDGCLIHRGFRLFDHPKHFPLSNPNIKWDVAPKKEEGEYELTVKAEAIAFFAYIDSNKFDFVASDNFFSLNKGESYNITLSFKEKVPEKALKESLIVGSLFDLLK